MIKYIDFQIGRELEWLEFNLLMTGIPLSKGKITSLTKIEDESEIDHMIGELEERNSLYIDPIYRIENNKITPLKTYKEIPEYFLCIYYAFYGAGDNSNGTKLFESISGEALKYYLQGDVYILGFPEGKNLNEYLDEISLLTHEERGIQAHFDYKDDGVDVIGYKLFNDKRSANCYVLLQCASGMNWSKKKEISLNRWTNYIHWYPQNILSSISTVDYVSKRNWMKRTSDYGLLFDRIRIYNNLSEVSAELREVTMEWCETKISSICDS